MTDTGFELSTNVADTMNLMSDLSLQNRSIGSGAGLMNQVMSFAGLSDAKGLNLLFSPVIDKAIDNVLDIYDDSDRKKLRGGMSFVKENSSYSNVVTLFSRIDWLRWFV